MEITGHKKGVLYAYYKTTHYRFSKISPVSIVQIPLYNTYPRNDEFFSTFLVFESVRILVRYRGCDYLYADY